MRIGMRARAGLWAAMTALVVCAGAQAQDTQDSKQGSQDLTNASLEDLMQVEVTSVSNKEQTLSRTAAAGLRIESPSRVFVR